MSKNPANVTVYGRLSFPVWTYKEAVARNAAAPANVRKADEATVTPEFNLVLEQNQLDKFIAHVENVYFPWVNANFAAGEKRNSLEKKHTDMLLKTLTGDLEVQPPYVPLKPVSEKTLSMAPEAVAMIKVVGQRGLDLEQKAIVNSEDELVVPEPDLLVYPVVRPIGRTVHKVYPGAYVAATMNLYTFISGKLPGFSASASTAVFKADADRFGGGVAVDEEDIFED